LFAFQKPFSQASPLIQLLFGKSSLEIVEKQISCFSSITQTPKELATLTAADVVVVVEFMMCEK